MSSARIFPLPSICDKRFCKFSLLLKHRKICDPVPMLLLTVCFRTSKNLLGAKIGSLDLLDVGGSPKTRKEFVNLMRSVCVVYGFSPPANGVRSSAIFLPRIFLCRSALRVSLMK